MRKTNHPQRNPSRRNNHDSLNVSSLPGLPAKQPATPVIIGRIARPIGIQGEIKVYSISHEPNRFTGMREITVRLNERHRRLSVLNTKRTGQFFRLTIEGINNPEEAAILSGCEIVIDESERLKLPDDEYYVDDLVGMRAVADDGTELGFIQEVMHQDHHDLWVIEGQFGEILVPAIKEFILEIDLNRHCTVIRRIEGLWAEK